MSEFKVGDRVITRWGEEAREWGLSPGVVPDGEHTILAAGSGDAISVFLDCKYFYPTCLIEKIDDSPENDQHIIERPSDIDEVEKRIKKRNQSNQSFRDECAMRVMQGDWTAHSEGGYYSTDDPIEFLVQRAKLFYRMADAMLEARKK